MPHDSEAVQTVVDKAQGSLKRVESADFVLVVLLLILESLIGRADVPDRVVGPGLSESFEASRGQPDAPMPVAASSDPEAVTPIWKLGQAGRYELRSQDSR